MGKDTILSVSIIDDPLNEVFVKHALLPFGITLCGITTKDYDRELFPNAKYVFSDDELFDYKVHNGQAWEVTCPHCMEIFNMLPKPENNTNIN